MRGLLALAGVGLVAGLAAAPAMVAAKPHGAPGTAILVRTDQHLQVALATSRQMLGGEGLTTQAAEVIVCGPGVDALAAEAPVPGLADAQQVGVDVVACGLSLSRRGVDPEALQPGVRVVANGLVEMLTRDLAGWATVAL